MTQELTIDKEPKPLFNFTPTSLKEAMDYAKIIAESELVPKDYKGKPGNVLVAVQMGMEVGLKPLQAIQNIAVINGRPSLWGDAMLALVRAHPAFESIIEEQSETEAVCTVKRKSEPEKTLRFSMDDAKKAGLSGKDGPWRNYPKRMLQMRARGFALRDTFPDVLKGLSMAEEARDYIDSEAEDISALAEKAKAMREEFRMAPPVDPAKLEAAERGDQRPDISKRLNGSLSISSLTHEYGKLTEDERKEHFQVYHAKRKALEKTAKKEEEWMDGNIL